MSLQVLPFEFLSYYRGGISKFPLLKSLVVGGGLFVYSVTPGPMTRILFWTWDLGLDLELDNSELLERRNLQVSTFEKFSGGWWPV